MAHEKILFSAPRSGARGVRATAQRRQSLKQLFEKCQAELPMAKKISAPESVAVGDYLEAFFKDYFKDGTPINSMD